MKRQPFWPVCLLALAAAFAVVSALLPPPAVQAQPEEVTPARVDGQTRFHTAANVATLTFEQAGVAHIAFAGNFPDALAASYAAGSVAGPVLLSATESVPAPTLAALAELGVERVVLVGGTAVLGEQVASQLAAEGYEVERLFGADRYQTAAAVATRYATTVGVGRIEGDRTALLASGADFPDALAAGPVAAGEQLPLFLTPPDRTIGPVNGALQQLGIERLVVLGGTAAVSSGVVQEYQAAGYEVERWSGPTRLETAQVIATNAIERLAFSPALTLLARGDAFSDALSASAHGGALSAPLLLAQEPTVLGNANLDWFSAHCPDIEAIRAIGGVGAVAEVVLSSAVQAAAICFDAEPIDIIGPASVEDRRSDPFPGIEGPAQLVEVRAARHTGFDRVVFEFAGPEQPGWMTVTDVPPATEAGSGHPIPVAGDAYIDVNLAFAVARYAGGVYEGPDRIAVDGDVVTELVLTGDFESHLSWAIGLEDARAYAIGFIDNPARVIIDVLHD